ncbi:hypothetical protein HanPI659440_Chr17g0694031 [Helianthus annuus]|nr:hypothetical protein HanPI659440_Chr17g0694031 [Helianthus annuus]
MFWFITILVRALVRLVEELVFVLLDDDCPTRGTLAHFEECLVTSVSPLFWLFFMLL